MVKKSGNNIPTVKGEINTREKIRDLGLMLLMMNMIIMILMTMF